MSIIKSGSGVVDFDMSVANDANFYTGGFNSDALHADPLVVGHAVIIWTRFPDWVDKSIPGFKQMTQKNFAGFDGLADIELATAAATEGFSQNEYHVAQNLGAKPSAFNIKHSEYSGSPIRKGYQYWVSGIRDPRTGIATYPKEHKIPYSAKNHTAELMYIVLRPDANNSEISNVIEFASYWTAVMPKKIPLAHLNYTKGTQTVPNEIDIPFSGIFHIGEAIDTAAQELLKSSIGFEFMTENDYKPENAKASG